MRSIRRDLVLRGIAAVAVILSLVALATYLAIDRILLSRLDDGLRQEAQVFASLIEVGPEGIECDFDNLDLSDFEGSAPKATLLVQTDEGEILHRSPPKADRPTAIQEHEVGLRWTESSAGRVRQLTLQIEPRVEVVDPGEEPFEVDPDDLQPVWIELARVDVLRRDFLSRFLGSYALVLVIALVGLSLLLAAVATRSLRSLSDLAERIEALPADGSVDRVRVGAVPDEVLPIVQRLDALLARVKAAVTREKSFTADVAHELRTPLAGLRSVIEVGLHRERSAAEYRQALQESLAVVRQTEAMADRLLQIHRLDTGALQVERALLDLRALVAECWKLLGPEVEQKGLRPTLELAPEVPVHSDPALLGALVINLLDNAVSHADEGGTVGVAVRTVGGYGVLRVRNSGSEIGADEVEVLFDRFSRGDPARAATGRHVGLGLAVARRIAEVLGAELELRSVRGGEFTAELRVPGAV